MEIFFRLYYFLLKWRDRGPKGRGNEAFFFTFHQGGPGSIPRWGTKQHLETFLNL